jgi:hypothetical protein
MVMQKSYFLRMDNPKIHIARHKDFPERHVQLLPLRKLEDNVLNKCYNMRAFYIETLRNFTVIEMS